MTAGTHTPRNRREAEALARLVQLLADGVAFTEAVWTASAHGMDLDTARLVDLHDTHTRTAAPVATSHTPGPWLENVIAAAGEHPTHPRG